MNRVPRSAPHSRPKKIAVLGSGIASLSAVFELTSQEGWEKKYDITVYQQGWRLGGKCAGGRNPDMGYRNEETGFYMLMGFYANMFKLMEDAYQELQRSPDHPFATWEDAIKIHPCLAHAEYINHRWLCHITGVSESSLVPFDPGQNAEMITMWDTLRVLLEMAGSQIDKFFRLNSLTQDPVTQEPGVIQEDFLTKIASMIMQKGTLPSPEFAEIANRFWRIVGGDWGKYVLDMLPEDILLIITKVLRAILDNLRTSDASSSAFSPQGIIALGILSQKIFGVARETAKKGYSASETTELLAELFVVIRDKINLFAQSFSGDPDTYHTRVGIDCGFTILIGALRDGVVEAGSWDGINDQDLLQWLRKHGASEETRSSSYLTAIYDALSAYKNGDTTQGDCEAGTAIHFLMRALFLYRGSVIWHLQSGISETIILPVYQVLKKRGVKFKFFHQVLGLHLDSDQPQEDSLSSHSQKKQPQERLVKRITLREQARVKKGAEYEPLIRVNGLEAWTTRPRYEQLIEGEDMKNFGLDMESYWADWDGFYTTTKHKEHIVTLEHGRDFDSIISGISISALPAICGELLQDPQSERLRQMVKHIRSAATQGLQVWYNATLHYLGWENPQPYIGGFPKPYNTWAALSSHLQYAQCNPMADPTDLPKSLMYFFAIFPDSPQYSHNPLAGSGTVCPEWIPSPSHHHYHQECLSAAKATGLEFIETQMHYLLPVIHTPQDDVNWNLLANMKTDTTNDEILRRSKRFDAQYWCANVNPTDRNIYPAVGSAKYRLKPDETGYSNLYFVGDWTKTSLNVGCLEDAAISGKMAARSISGQYFFIPGEG